MFDGWKEGFKFQNIDLTYTWKNKIKFKNKRTGPFTPKVIGDKLYGRGSVDDGYSIFAAISIVKTC